MSEGLTPRLRDALIRLTGQHQAFTSGAALLIAAEPAQMAADILNLPGIEQVFEWDVQPQGERLATEPPSIQRNESEPPTLILIREPNILADRRAWQAILPDLADHLHPDGVLIATTSLLPDAAFINDTLADSGLQMMPGSPYTPVPVDSTGRDRYILIYERPAHG
jgi:hypothetical protein